MKRINIKVMAVALAITCLLAGCSNKQVSQEETPVAKINDEVVTWKEFHDVYAYYLNQYGITDETDEANADTVANLRTNILDSLIDEKVQYVNAVKLGLDVLTDEEKEQVNTTLVQITDNWRNQFNAQAMSSYPDLSDNEKIQKAREMYDNYVKETGYTEEYVIGVETRRMALEKLFQQVTEGVEPTEDDVMNAYTQNLQAAKEEYAETPSFYENDYLDETAIIYYHPAGFRRVKHILISLSDDDVNAIYELRNAGDDAAADAKRDECLQSIRAEAEVVLASLQADGSNFDSVMREKSTDPGSTNYPNGYVTYNESTTFVPEFVTGTFAISKVGEISPLVATDYGYHILRWEEEISEGDVSYENIREAVKEQLWAANREEKYTEMVEQWKTEVTIERFEDKI